MIGLPTAECMPARGRVQKIRERRGSWLKGIVAAPRISICGSLWLHWFISNSSCRRMQGGRWAQRDELSRIFLNRSISVKKRFLRITVCTRGSTAPSHGNTFTYENSLLCSPLLRSTILVRNCSSFGEHGVPRAARLQHFNCTIIRVSARSSS